MNMILSKLSEIVEGRGPWCTAWGCKELGTTQWLNNNILGCRLQHWGRAIGGAQLQCLKGDLDFIFYFVILPSPLPMQACTCKHAHTHTHTHVHTHMEKNDRHTTNVPHKSSATCLWSQRPSGRKKYKSSELQTPHDGPQRRINWNNFMEMYSACTDDNMPASHFSAAF